MQAGVVPNDSLFHQFTESARGPLSGCSQLWLRSFPLPGTLIALDRAPVVMARKEDRKKHKQRLRDKKKDARARQHQLSLRPSPYPGIAINTDHVNPAFRNAVKELAESFSYTDDSHCPPDIRAHYRTIACIGWVDWYAAVRGKAYLEHDDSSEAEQWLQRSTLPTMLHLGTWLFQRLPTIYTSRFSPEHFFRVDNIGSGQVVSFKLMDHVKEQGQHVYTPPTNPTIPMQGVEWQIAMYCHALERVCSRLVPAHSMSYSHCYDLYLRFNQGLLRYIPATLADGSEAARVEFLAPLSTVFYEKYAAWARALLDLPAIHIFPQGASWPVVLGYLPLHIQGRFARAKTFLLPGFSKTPEFALGMREATSDAERLLLSSMTDEGRRTFDLADDAIAAIKWYHDHGVPQIYPPERSFGP